VLLALAARGINVLAYTFQPPAFGALSGTTRAWVAYSHRGHEAEPVNTATVCPGVRVDALLEQLAGERTATPVHTITVRLGTGSARCSHPRRSR